MTSGVFVLREFAPLFHMDVFSLFDLVGRRAQAGTSTAYCGKYDCVEDRGTGAAVSAHVSGD